MRRIRVGKGGSSRSISQRYMVILGLMVFVAGCAGGQQLAKQERASIRAVSIGEVKRQTSQYTGLKLPKFAQLNELALRTFGIVPYEKGIPRESVPRPKETHVIRSYEMGRVATVIKGTFGESIRVVSPRSISFFDGRGTQTVVNFGFDVVCYIIQDGRLWLVTRDADRAIQEYWMRMQDRGLQAHTMIYFAMARNNIDAGQIIREEFTAELRNANLFSVVPGGGDAEFGLLGGCTFEGKPGLSGHVKPFVDVRGTLVRSNGKLVWKGRGYAHYLSGKTPSRTIEEYLNDPGLIREAIAVASQIAVEELVKSLLKE